MRFTRALLHQRFQQVLRAAETFDPHINASLQIYPPDFGDPTFFLPRGSELKQFFRQMFFEKSQLHGVLNVIKG